MLFTPEQVEAIVRDYQSAGLPPQEVALLSFTEKVALDASRIAQTDIEELKRHGFSDAEILDIAMTVGARSFFGKVLDAVGADPDERYETLERSLRDTLTVGRPTGTRIAQKPETP